MRLTRRSAALGVAVAAVVSLPLVVTITADATTGALPFQGRPVTASRAEAASPAAPVAAGLDDPVHKDLAMQIVASAEYSTLDWHGQYGHLEDIGNGRGYSAGIVGFRPGTSDLLAVVAEYARRKRANALIPYLPALREASESASHTGLGAGFTEAWRAAAADPDFQQVQRDERDRLYFDPAVARAKADGLRALGQFVYFDAAVVHGRHGMDRIRAVALSAAPPPAQGGDEVTYLDAYLDARAAELRRQRAGSDTSRVDTAQRAFLRAGNLDLHAPLAWQVGGDGFRAG